MNKYFFDWQATLKREQTPTISENTPTFAHSTANILYHLLHVYHKHKLVFDILYFKATEPDNGAFYALNDAVR